MSEPLLYDVPRGYPVDLPRFDVHHLLEYSALSLQPINQILMAILRAGDEKFETLSPTDPAEDGVTTLARSPLPPLILPVRILPRTLPQCSTLSHHGQP